MWILALEASTTSAKAMLYDTVTGTWEEKTRPYGKMNCQEGLHDPDRVLNCMADIGREISRGKKADIISLSGAWHSVLLCTRELKPATPVYPWSATHAAKVCKRLRQDKAFVDEYYHRTGCMVNATYPLFKLLYLKEQGFATEQHFILDQGTYNNYRLTGQMASTRCLMSGSGLMNIHTREYDETYLDMAGLRKEQLARLTEWEDTVPLSKEGAVLLGQREGTPVILTNSDGGLNQIGVGAVKEDIMTFSAGTSGAMRLSTKAPVIPASKGTWCYLSPTGWLSGAATAGCCNCIDWFKNQVAGRQVTYKELEQDSSHIMNTPVFLPFLYGERCPGWDDERSGGFSRLRPRHTMTDMYRGVQQGVLFHLFHCYQILTRAAGIPEKIKLSGGILHSLIWSQMCADIFGRELEIDESKQSSLMGAVVLARVKTGGLSDIRDYTPEIKRIICPDLDKTRVYKDKFEEFLTVYREGLR